MNMLAMALIGFGVKVLTQPKMISATESGQPITALPRITQAECASRGGIWTGTDCLGAKTVAQINAEAEVKRQRLMAVERKRAEYEAERLRYTDSRLAPTTRDRVTTQF
jgi:hypothetical protein